MVKHREKFEIIANMLGVIKDGARKTHVMYKANLSYLLLRKYLEELLSEELIYADGNYFFLTNKGIEFLELYANYEESCEKFNQQKNQIDVRKNKLENLLTTKNSIV